MRSAAGRFCLFRRRVLCSLGVAGMIAVAQAAGPRPAIAQGPVTVPGLGSLDFPVTTEVPAARDAFLRGMLLLHLFHYQDAARAFREAEESDPGMTMAYWGEAMAWNYPVWNIQYPDSGRAALRRLGATAMEREARARTPRERGYLEAVEVLYGEGAKPQRDTLYAERMAHLSMEWPDDDEARLFHALALMGLSQGVRNVPTYLRAADLAEAVFRRQPDHPGAEHYLIHAVDDPEHAARGLEAARALAVSAPDAHHAQHMTSHIFMALGLWKDVVHANEQAMRVVNAARAASGRDSVWCGHYNAWLDYGYVQAGRVEDARALLHACQAQAKTMLERSTATDPDEFAQFSAVAMWSRFLLDTEEWNGDDALWSPMLGPSPGPRVTWHFAHGFAAARRGDLAAAEKDLIGFREAAREMVPAPGSPAVGDPETVEHLKRLRVLERELAGVIASARGRDGEALALLREAAAVEDSMAYAFGPPMVDKPAHELLGEELLARERYAEAAREFTTALRTTPNRALALRGKVEAERRQQAGAP